MWNGFYDLNEIKNNDVLKRFFRDALELSTKSHVDILKKWRRERFDEITPAEYIENHIKLSTHNVCINRFEYNKGASWAEEVAEIGSSTFTDPCLYLFLYLNLSDLDILVEKYKLKKKEL